MGIENPELKALCEGKSPQCICIEDAEAKAKCEAALDGEKSAISASGEQQEEPDTHIFREENAGQSPKTRGGVLSSKSAPLKRSRRCTLLLCLDPRAPIPIF